jgi:hypothetical protein
VYIHVSMLEMHSISGQSGREQEVGVDLQEPRDAQCGLGLEGVDLTAHESTQIGVGLVARSRGEPTLRHVLHDHESLEPLEVVKAHVQLPEACPLGRREMYVNALQNVQQ